VNGFTQLKGNTYKGFIKAVRIYPAKFAAVPTVCASKAAIERCTRSNSACNAVDVCSQRFAGIHGCRMHGPRTGYSPPGVKLNRLLNQAMSHDPYSLLSGDMEDNLGMTCCINTYDVECISSSKQRTMKATRGWRVSGSNLPKRISPPAHTGAGKETPFKVRASLMRKTNF